jgi:hypothetical protein
MTVNPRFSLCVVSAFATMTFANVAHAAQPGHAAGNGDGESAGLDPTEDIYAAASTVGNAELDELRGGFRVAGMDVSLGADIRTYLNGELVLHTLVDWSDVGRTQTQFVSDVLTPSAARLVQASALGGGELSMTIGGSTVFLANDGKTAFAHRTEDGLQNVLINTADNQNITQTVDATVTLGGYESFNSDLISNRLADNIASTLGGVMIAASAPR